MNIPQSDSSRNFKIDSKQIFVDLPSHQQFFGLVRKRGKSVEWPTFGSRFGFQLIVDVIIVDWTNKRIHAHYTPFAELTFEIEEQISAVDDAISQLLAKEDVNEEYVVDFFTQEAIFENKKSELKLKYSDKEVLVCGGEIFVGNSFDDLEKNAKERYPNRPFYSHSFKNEYSTF